MSEEFDYFMESPDEISRLDLKTNFDLVASQARWAGIEPGMRVIDVGCGIGKTSFFLSQLVGDKGEVVGLDASPQRIAYAREQFGRDNLTFCCQNIHAPLAHLGQFDFLWTRFFLEYHKEKSFQIVKSLAELLRQSGIMCLVDLDYNCMSHYGIPLRLENTILQNLKILEEKFDFDPFVGRKLYTYLYDLGFADIDVFVGTHHLFFGDLDEVDAFNWLKKVEVTSKKGEYRFEEYPGGYDEFLEEFKEAFFNPRRFTYTPVIQCRGVKK